MEERPATEVWFRNAGYYIQQLAEIGTYNLVFDKAYTLSRRIDVKAYASLYFGIDAPWRVLVIHGDRAVLHENGFRNPTAVYPVWSANKQSIKQLVDMMRKPWSERQDLINDAWAPLDRKPIAGQRHIIVIKDLPNCQGNSGKQFMEDLSEFQEEHPDVTFFIHGLYSFGILFGKKFRMVDVEVRDYAAKGRVYLPSGRVVFPSEMRGGRFWIEVLGYYLSELDDPKMRCKFNVSAALFAGQYYQRLSKFKIQRGVYPSSFDLETPDVQDYIMENSLVFTKRLVRRPGDRIVCDDCSLWMSCKYYREGAVCVVPGSEMKDVADMFKSRDASNIANALSRLVAVNTDRIEAAVTAESSAKDKTLDPDLTRLVESTFKMGHELLKIVDPTQRAGKSAVNVSVNAGASHVEIGMGDSAQMAAHVVNILESRGFKREHITDAMIEEVLRELATVPPQAALPQQVSIPGTVVP